MKLEPQDSTLSQAHNVQTKENSSPDLAQSSPNLPTSTFKISLNIILYYKYYILVIWIGEKKNKNCS